MNYIHKFVSSESKTLEVGVGTGRYSVVLVMEGYDVTVVELVENNLEILRRNAASLENITSYQGDAENLSIFVDNTGFDIKEFDELFSKKPVQKIALVGTDSVLELAEKAHVMHLFDEDFRLFSKYHLKICEKRELLGTQTHLLYIYAEK
jgi:phospholipid N-methyltransferase